MQQELVKFQSPFPPGVDRGGIFSTPFSMGQAFLVSSRAKADGQGDWPDLQLWFLQVPYSPMGNRSVEGQDFLVAVALGRQKSVGKISFNTTAYLNGIQNDTQLALIDNKFYSEKSDVLTLIEGRYFCICRLQLTLSP